MTTKMVKYLKPGNEVEGKLVEKVNVQADGTINVTFVGVRAAMEFGAGACVEVR